VQSQVGLGVFFFENSRILADAKVLRSSLPGQFESGLSQKQLQKSVEQYQKIPKSVVMQHKIEVPMINFRNRTKYDLQNELKWFISHIFILFQKSLKRVKNSNLGTNL